jgi:hypothetical protein
MRPDTPTLLALYSQCSEALCVSSEIITIRYCVYGASDALWGRDSHDCLALLDEIAGQQDAEKRNNAAWLASTWLSACHYHAGDGIPVLGSESELPEDLTLESVDLEKFDFGTEAEAEGRVLKRLKEVLGEPGLDLTREARKKLEMGATSCLYALVHGDIWECEEEEELEISVAISDADALNERAKAQIDMEQQ